MERYENIVAILRGLPPNEIIEHLDCLVNHGITRVEIPTNSPHWIESVLRARTHFGRTLELGVGTVLTAQQVKECAAVGADFILTPNLDVRVIKEALNLKLCIVAGVFSATEIFQAASWGLTQVKLFPASALPLDYASQIKGPLSAPLRFMAVGGVSVVNAATYLKHYDCVGIGSSLYRPGQSVSLTEQNCRRLENALS